MVKHYPHTITWVREGSPSTEAPGTGFPVPGTPGETVTAVCRYENFRGGSTKEFKNKKNETVLQRGTIFIKKGEQIPPKFETVTVVSNDPEVGLMFEGEILNSYTGQLNATLAV